MCFKLLRTIKSGRHLELILFYFIQCCKVSHILENGTVPRQQYQHPQVICETKLISSTKNQMR